jgi:hypothetical protein
VGWRQHPTEPAAEPSNWNRLGSSNVYLDRKESTMRFLLATAVLFGLAFAAATCGSDVTEYQVTVSFNETVTQPNMDAVHDLLREYDEDVDFLIQESFPPTGVAYVKTDDEEFCSTIEAELSGRSYVRAVRCEERPEPSGDDGDTPVQYP